MSKIIIFSIVFLQICFTLQTSKNCDFKECNHEGQCKENHKNEKTCTCIGTKFFKGLKCSEAVDNCQGDNPCKNGAKCRNLIGQFICEECETGFGGQWCDLEISNVFKKMLLYFNHYGFYGETHKFLLIVETLGEIPFSLEFVSDNYAVDSFETNPAEANRWTFSKDLAKVIKKLGIRYHQDLPYSNGYYHTSSETFWNVGELDLVLRSYDTNSGTKLFYQNHFKLLMVNRNEECAPKLSFIYGKNPLDPLMLDIASYNNFEVIVEKRCFKNSKITYHWSVFNAIGFVNLHDFGYTNELLLKIRPFKFWFNYQGEVMSSYRIVVRMVEEYKNTRRNTEARCFIFVLPKPVFANIKGGNYTEIGVKQDLILDASNSRDFALAPNVLQDLFYTWDCFSADDANNEFCKRNMGSSTIMTIKADKLKLHNTYNFNLNINSKVNKFISDQAYQIVKILESTQLSIDIDCLRNCARNEFVQDELLHLKAAPLGKQFSKTATYQWFIEGQIVGEGEHFIYTPKENEKLLYIQVVVKDENITGKAVQIFKVNLPPQNGSCFIEPNSGESFFTDFHIKCENFMDKDTPLNYEYFVEKGFPLQRTNEREIYTKLPECNGVVVKICDQFQDCIENKLKVSVKEEGKALEAFVKDKERGLKYILEKGDILTAMILLRSVTKFTKTLNDLVVILKAVERFHIKTLLQVEQFLEISQNLVEYNLPLTAEKSHVFNQYLLKLQSGFKSVLRDGEIKSFKKLSYENSLQKIIKIMQLFAQTWENIPANHISATQTILSSNPLMELYPQFPDFNINIAMELKNWLESTKTIQKCFEFMTFAANGLYAPWEHVFLVEKDDLSFKTYAFDNKTQQAIELNHSTVNISLNEPCIRELQELFNSTEILMQAAFLHSNPFWWHPSENPVNSQVFLFSVLSRKTSKTVKYLRNPFEFQLKLEKASNTFRNKNLGLIKNSQHMPLYSLELAANALFIISFLQAEKPLKFLITINKPPKSFEVLKYGNNVYNKSAYQSFVFPNPFNKKSQVFIAVLMVEQFENVTFSFYSEIKECLFWDFSLKEPQWSLQGCKPKLDLKTQVSLTCLCHHFSAFTVRSYQAPIQEDLKPSLLLTELNINWHVIEFYLILTMFSSFLLLFNLYYYKIQPEFLLINSLKSLNNDIEISIFTGSHWNAGTSANISLRFVSKKGPFALTICHNPANSFLKRNSLSKILLSSQEVNLPLKLIISNDLSGRYPSWYCHKIIITNLKIQQKQTFLIDQWISQKPIEVLESSAHCLSFKQRFWDQLSKVYINWFQFEPLWGCWLYDDLNRFERCCIELCSLMVPTCLVACYFGSTTLETYEEERNLYNNLNFNILQLISLSVVVCLLNFIIKLMFSHSVWLYDKRKI